MTTNPVHPTTERLEQLTGAEVDKSLDAVTYLLDSQVSGHVTDKVLMAKLSSLQVDLRKERDERRALARS